MSMQMMEVEVTAATSMEQNYHGPNAADMVHDDVRMEDRMEGEPAQLDPSLVNQAPHVQEEGLQQMTVDAEATPPIAQVLIRNTTGDRNRTDDRNRASKYLQRLQFRMNTLLYEKEELARKHANDLAGANERIQALENENAELRSQIAVATSQQCRRSTEVSPSILPLDDVIERASRGLVEERVATPVDSAFTTRPRQLTFGGPPVASASTSATQASNEGDVDRAVYLAMQSRVELAERELHQYQREEEKLKSDLRDATAKEAVRHRTEKEIRLELAS
jgi:hypothetical protein